MVPSSINPITSVFLARGVTLTVMAAPVLASWKVGMDFFLW
jgi:hypothetical protein